MSITSQFQELVSDGRPVGEVIAVDKFFVKVKGLHPISAQSLILFEDGTTGYVRATNSEYVSVFSMGTTPPRVVPPIGSAESWQCN